MLEVSGLTVDYVTSDNPVRAVDDVSLEVKPGEFVGIVGESGCGKSTLLFAIARLLSPPAVVTAGSVTFRGENLVTMTERRLNAIRWQNMSVVMQSAMNALNPVTPVGAQFADALRAHGTRSRKAVAARSAQVLRLVGVDPVHLGSYPHQLSGGMRQRAMIAMALLFTPDLVIMDEPTSALDVVAQRSLMTQIKELQRELGFAVIFVTHDMSLVSHYSDRLVVMYAGQVAEAGPTRQMFDRPLHPYARGLLEAFPGIRGPKVPLSGIPGAPPDLSVIHNGCRFSPRCPAKLPACETTPPALLERGDTSVRCLLYAPAPGHRDGGEPAARQASPEQEATAMVQVSQNRRINGREKGIHD
jgi:peptide/nickel transport system ATP-binding protein